MDEKTYKGKLITFEGPDGGGKTTQIQMLSDYLKERGFEIVLTREPGGTGIGISIRNILLDPSFHNIHSRTELLLFMADRVQHVQDLILPSLKAGKIVLCDRYVDSTVAYQVGGRGFEKSWIDELNRFSTFEIMPDLTFLLDVDYEVGIKRATRHYEDRFEQEARAFHDRIRQTYLDLLENNPDRIKYLDTTKNHVEIIQKTIRRIVFETKILGQLHV